MTSITGLQHCPSELERLAKELKAQCGAGGTVQGNTILVQGDQRQRVAAFFEKQGYRVKMR